MSKPDIEEAVRRLDVADDFKSWSAFTDPDGARIPCLMARAPDLRALIASWRERGARVVELERAALELFPYSEKLAALRAQNAELAAALRQIDLMDRNRPQGERNFPQVCQAIADILHIARAALAAEPASTALKAAGEK